MNHRLTVLSVVFLFAVSALAQPQPKFDLFQTDAQGKILNASRSICGEDTMSDMLEEDEDFQVMGNPVGQYREKSLLGGVARCTGTLISNDLFLTARHCFQRSCDNIEVAFNFLAARDQQEVFKCSEVVEKGGSSNEDDYMIIRLEGKPGVKWGYYPPAKYEPATRQELMMLHHPAGKPMKVSWDECAVTEIKDNMLHHRCDTEPGSSGSGIFTRSSQDQSLVRIVGVHTLGGCTASGQDSSNSGPKMTHLFELSPTLKELAK